MKESKDPFDRMILDDLEREADEIRRNVAVANLPPMTNEQKERIRENIQKELDLRAIAERVSGSLENRNGNDRKREAEIWQR